MWKTYSQQHVCPGKMSCDVIFISVRPLYTRSDTSVYGIEHWIPIVYWKHKFTLNPFCCMLYALRNFLRSIVEDSEMNTHTHTCPTSVRRHTKSIQRVQRPASYTTKIYVGHLSAVYGYKLRRTHSMPLHIHSYLLRVVLDICVFYFIK